MICKMNSTFFGAEYFLREHSVVLVGVQVVRGLLVQCFTFLTVNRSQISS